MYSKYLSHFVNGISDVEAKKLKLPIRDLLIRHLIIRHTKKTNKLVSSVSEGVPRWAFKFKFLHKKYGIVNESSETTTYIISSKGARLLNAKPPKDKEEEEEAEDIKKQPEPKEESEQIEE